MSEFMHEGVKRRSGRYEWGSGENPYQHEPWYNPGSNPKETVKKLKENGLTNSQISEILKNEGLNEKQASSAMEIKTTQYRNYIKIAREKKLAQDIRKYIIEVVSENGGHLASNLGVVELTLALESVFDVNKDKIVWDVGHQTYIHKILNGRK